MICSYCASELPPGALFCGECGHAVPANRTRSNDETDTVIAGPKDAAPVLRERVQPPVHEITEPPISPRLRGDILIPKVDVPAVEPAPAGPAAPAPSPSLPELDPEDSGAAPEAAAPDSGTERCTECGAVLDPHDIFCGECGSVRRAPQAARPSDTVVLDSSEWRLLAAAAAEAPAPEPTPEPIPEEPPVQLDDEPALEPSPFADDTEATRIVARPAPVGDPFVLQFSTGEHVVVTGTGLVGRNPVAEPGEYFDEFVTIVDPGKSVSKTHLEFGQADGAFWIADRYSGNGTIVREPGQAPRRSDAGKRSRIVRGTRVDIGEQFFTVS